MDNVTHTLIGVLAGEAVARAIPRDEQGLPANTRRNVLVTLAAIGSNLPDLDLVYSFLGSKVNYLLHHRGHTHTIVGALILGALVWLITRALLRRRGLTPSRRDLSWMAAVLAFTPLLHIGMDATNSYGVHPFWPLHDGWHYGDSVFIVEPLLWAACAPLVFLVRTLFAKLLVGLLLIAGLVLGFVSGLVPGKLVAVLVAINAAMLAVGWRAPPRAALAAGIGLWIGVTILFVTAGRLAGRQADAIAARHFPQASLLDHVLTPLPANPLCWELILVQHEPDAVILRRAMLSLAPALFSAGECPTRSLEAPGTAPLEPVAAANSDALKWYGQIVTSQRLLAEHVRTNCEAAAAMRFIRAPWLAALDEMLILGDLRYDRERAASFAEVDLSRPPRCPWFVPPWPPPRSDILP
jgi:inner membrane protein